MPQPCSICNSPSRDDIDRSLARGEPNRRVAARHGLTEQSVRRHKASHLPERLKSAQRAAEVASADDVLAEVAALRVRAASILETAEDTGDLRSAIAAIREARGCLSLLAELTGELDRRPMVNLLLAPEWIAVRTAMLAALAPYPEARAAAAGSLESLGVA